MIRIAPPSQPLSPAEDYGLSVLVDLSRLVVLESPPGAEAAGPSAQAADRPQVVTLYAAAPPASGDGVASPDPVADLAGVIVVADGAVTVPRALLRAVAAIAGAGIEQAATARDRYGRTPSSANPLVAAGVEREPVVSVAGARLREAVVQAAGSRPVRMVAPWPDGHRWCAAMSHDVDVVAAWPAFTAFRLAELLGKGQARLAARVAAAAVPAIAGDPVWSGVHGVLATEQRYGMTSTWFMLCGTPTAATFRAGDLTYHAESPAARRIIAAIGAAGDELGLHGSFATGDAAGAFDAQRLRLRTLSGSQAAGVRQHYLRMRPGVTQRWMASAGFRYDATYGFPDRNAFRLGVVDIVPAWDAAAERSLPLDEVPLMWMDRAQSKYQGIENPDQWIADAMAVADVCRRAEGLWVGLWHPNLTAALGFPGAPAAFERLVAALAAERPYMAPLGRVTEWRSLRRAVRATRVDGDGNVTLAGPSVRAFRVVAEDADGSPREQLPATGSP
jgi:hypothetical protein